jgi:hypothetical protein
MPPPALSHSEYDVVVVVREQKMVLDYSQAVKWARFQCEAYKIADEFAVERKAANPTQ